MATFPLTATVAGSGRRGFVDGNASREVYFDSPLEMCLLPDYKILLSDGRNNCLRLLDLAQQTVQTVPTHSFLGPRSPVLIDGGAAAVVSDSGHNKLRMLQIRQTPGGSLDVEDCTIAGTGRAALADGPAESACFNRPSGLCVHSDGSILVADTGNHCIRRIAAKAGKPGLQVTTIAGSGHAGFSDGHGSEAMFNAPCALSITPDGTAVVVSDAGNHALRVMHAPVAGAANAAWTVTTLLGGQPGFADGLCAQATVREPSSLAVLPVDTDGSKQMPALLLSDAANNAVRSLTALSAAEMDSSEVPALVGMSPDGQVGFVDLRETAGVKGAQDKVVAVLPGSTAREGIARGQHNRTIVVSPMMLQAASSSNADADSRKASAKILEAATQVACTAQQQHGMPNPTVLIHPDPISVLLTHMRLGKIQTVAGASPAVLEGLSPNVHHRPAVPEGSAASSLLASAASAAGLQHALSSLKRYEDGPSVRVARFRRPVGLCVLPADKGARCVLVADSGNHFIRVLLSSKALTTPTCPPLLLNVLTPNVLTQGLAELERVHEEGEVKKGRTAHVSNMKPAVQGRPSTESKPDASQASPSSSEVTPAMPPSVQAAKPSRTFDGMTSLPAATAIANNVQPQKAAVPPARAAYSYEGIGNMSTAELLAVIDAQHGEQSGLSVLPVSPPSATSRAVQGTAPVQASPLNEQNEPVTEAQEYVPVVRTTNASAAPASRRSSFSSVGSHRSAGSQASLSRQGHTSDGHGPGPLAVSALQQVSTRRLSSQAMQNRVSRTGASATYMANTDSRARASLHPPGYLQSQRLIRQAYATGVSITSPRVARRVQHTEQSIGYGDSAEGPSNVSLLELAESGLDLHTAPTGNESYAGSVAGKGQTTPALHMLSSLNALLESRRERLQPNPVPVRGAYTAKIGSADSFAHDYQGKQGVFRLAAGVTAGSSGVTASKSALERSKDPLAVGLLAAHALAQTAEGSSRASQGRAGVRAEQQHALDVDTMTADPEVLLNVSAALVGSSMNRSPSKRVQKRQVEQTVVPVLPAVLAPEAALAHVSRISAHSQVQQTLQPGAIKINGKPGLAGMQISAEQASKHPRSEYGSRDALAAEEMDAGGALVRALLLADAPETEADANRALAALQYEAADTSKSTLAPAALVTKRFVRHTLSSVSRMRDNGNAAPLTAPAFVNVPKLVSKKVQELKARAAAEEARMSGATGGGRGGVGVGVGVGPGARQQVDVASLITRTVSPQREMLDDDESFSASTSVGYTAPTALWASGASQGQAAPVLPSSTLARSTASRPGSAVQQGTQSTSGAAAGVQGEAAAMDASFDVVRALHPTFRRRPSMAKSAVASSLTGSALKGTGRDTMLKEIPSYAIMRE